MWVDEEDVDAPLEAWEVGEDCAVAEEKEDVGYRRPPTGTQFKPGQSGNPHGRPRKPRGHAAMFAGLLDLDVQVREGGREKKITAAEAVGRGLLAKAAKGDVRAVKFLMENTPREAQEDVRRKAKIEEDNSLFTKGVTDLILFLQDKIADAELYHVEARLRDAGVSEKLIKRVLFPGLEELKRLWNNIENIDKPGFERVERPRTRSGIPDHPWNC